MLTLSVQSQHSLDSDIGAFESVFLEHDFQHLLSVLLRVQWRFSQQNSAFLGVNLQLLIECVIPNVQDVVPGLDNTVLQRIGNLKHTSELSSFITNHNILNNASDFLASVKIQKNY